ncbi:LysR family transcriptional regulator [Actinospica robiniae]|uniref:LysR family transcriptional regulator n=1 Tax=Actinospica robiniae TaxID=304901 RepID=UPI0004124FB0|nr:LysR family transcriptional regulator [Actinospica robiniae]
MLDVHRLRLLRELSHRGTIAAVAQALSFTPSAVSQQLSTLEREAGVPLLARTGRRVTLTAAGRNLVEHAESVLEHLARAEAELARARTGPAGPVRIGSYPTAARILIPAALAALFLAHPLLEPRITELDPADVPSALRAAELDVALVHEYDFVPAPAEPGLSSEELFTEPLYLAAPAPGAITDHRRSPWIVSPPGTLCRTMAERACEAAGFSPQVRHEVDDFATVLALVALGQGVAIVPHLGAVNPPEGLALTRLPAFRRTRIAFRTGADDHPAISAVAFALRAAVPADLLA